MAVPYNSTKESRFYYLLNLTREGTTAQVYATFRDSLPMQQIGISDSVVVLSSDLGVDNQGMYLHDGVRWRWALPQTVVSQCIINGSRLSLYYDQTSDLTLPDSARLYRNGAFVEGSTTITTERGAVWVAVLPSASEAGSVHSVNGKVPDADGNIELDVGILSINDIEPDDKGNIVMDTFVNFSISIPGEPNPDATLFYQEMMDSLELESSSCRVAENPESDISFNVLLNGSSIGTFDFSASGATANIPKFSTTPGDIMTIIAPQDLEGASTFSLTFVFKRI